MKRRFSAATLCLLWTLLCFGCSPAENSGTDAFFSLGMHGRAAASICGYTASGEYFSGGVPKEGKSAGMFYFTWLGKHPSEQRGIYDVSKLSKTSPQEIWSAESDVSPMNEYHFWGEPLYGYYNSADKWVIRKHIEMFVNAGIGYLGLDATNAVLYGDVYEALFEVLQEFDEQGFDYPRICFLTNSDSRDTVRRLYDLYYGKPQYEKFWLYRDGKPFIALNKADFDFTDPKITAVTDRFSFRHIQWPYFPPYSAGFPWMSYDYPQYCHDGIMSVSVAQHTAGAMSREGNRGRGYDYVTGKNDTSLIDVCSNYKAQWAAALESDETDEVFITGWNEWMALKLAAADGSEVYFTDAFDYEFSRDIEPSKRENGDAYYLETVKNVKRFTSDCEGVCALERAEISIDCDVNKLFAENKAAVFPDLRGDAAPRDFAGAVPELHYADDSGRNDIVSVSVANDEHNLYILVECAQNVTEYYGSDWLNVKIVTGDKTYCINRNGQGVISCGAYENRCEYEVCDNRFWVKVSLEYLSGRDGKCALRVTDNIGEDALGVYAHGDSAPLGNLFYEYKFA